MKLNIPNFSFMNTKCKKNLINLPFYLDLRSPYLSTVVEYGPWYSLLKVHLELTVKKSTTKLKSL